MVVGDRNENSSLKVELSKVCRKRHADRWWWSWRLCSKVPEVDPAVPVLRLQPILSINSCPPAILELTTAILTRPNWTWFQTGWNSPVEFPRGWRIVHCCEKIVWTSVYRIERLPNCRLAFLGVIGVIFYRSVVISRTLKKKKGGFCYMTENMVDEFDLVVHCGWMSLLLWWRFPPD